MATKHPKQPSIEQRVSRLEMQLANDRLNRIERAIERAAEENDEFRRIVRGAITTQQDQIAALTHDVRTLVQQWEAYLRRLPPQ